MSVIIGLTGQFGSGCSELSKALSTVYNFKPYSFSTLIKEKATSRNIRKPERYQLQDIGNEFRKKEIDYWAKQIIRKIKHEEKEAQNYVVDGFRNIGEIEAFRKQFGDDFYLIAINVDNKEERWWRVKMTDAKKKWRQFDWEENRDRDERFPYGQQVARCVYEADIILNNSKRFDPFTETIQKYLAAKVERYVGLTLNTNPDRCQQNELRMQKAYLTAKKSSCIHRKVGAVLFDSTGQEISAGYNRPPFEGSCEDKFGACPKELWHRELWKKMWKWVEDRPCPFCGKKLHGLQDNQYYCRQCNFDVKNFLIPTKGSEHCIALHAEEWAIIEARKKAKNLENAVLFTTTFPCLQCALKIVESGVSGVYYVDPYPLPETRWINEDLFKELQIEKFEGIKSVEAFNRLFQTPR